MKSWFGWTLLVLVIAAVADGFYAYHWYFARDGSSARSGGEATLTELKPDAFRFLHTEQQTIPPTVVNGRTVDTITYGVFQFRYSHSNPLEFWGDFEDKKFATRFTNYRIHKKSSWEDLPVGYSFTAATTSILQPGVDYELLIPLVYPGLSDARELRVSAESGSGTFWSEAFPYPKK
jgi:hypothetical protein